MRTPWGHGVRIPFGAVFKQQCSSRRGNALDSTEIIEVRDFLAAHHPFDLLPAQALAEIARQVEISYVRKGHVVMKPGDDVRHLFVVRSGAAETRDPHGQLLARLDEGEVFGIRALLRGGTAVNQSTAIEDSLLFLLPRETFERLRRDHPPFAYFCAAFDGGRLADSADAVLGNKNLDLLSKRVGDLLVRGPVTIPDGATVREAAQAMRAEKVSCVMVTRDGRLAGILTDRDLRNRVVAENLPTDAPVTAVMTADPMSVEASAIAFDAMLLMGRHNIHHLPVMDKGAVRGCLTATTLINSQTASPLYLARKIHGCDSAGELAEAVARVPDMVHQLADAGATSRSIGHIVSTLTDAVTHRLIRLAEARLGPPPIPYAWLAAGSQARQEQTALSDQDNCLILHDSYDEAEHGAWFRSFAQFVNAGLDTCGYVYCPGEMMAQTDQWRQPLKVWKDYFTKWIDQPQPKALMLSCIFFDLRLVDGDAALFDELHDLVLEKSRKNGIFLAHMASNAMTHQPPIGFFRNFVLARGGEHAHTMDLKHNGVVPIIDLARVYALSAGLSAVNTHDRLLAAAEAKAISQDGARDLIDALEFISMTRLRHQARMIRDGEKPDNFLEPGTLSSFERTHLKNAFTVVKTLQAAMAAAYHLSRF